MERYGTSLDFPLLGRHVIFRWNQARRNNTNLDVNLVPAQHDGDVFTDTLEITMPVGHILVGDSRCDVKHDDATLSLDVVTVSESTKLFLACGIPDVEADGSVIGRKCKGVDLDTKSCWKSRSEAIDGSRLKPGPS